MGRKLVAYFSASGTTKKVAETVAQAGKKNIGGKAGNGREGAAKSQRR